LRPRTTELTLSDVRFRVLIVFALVIAGCDASNSVSDPGPSSSAVTPRAPSTPALATVGRRDAAACLLIGHASTWPLHTLMWDDGIGSAYYKAFDQDFKALLKEAWLEASPDSERARLMHQAMKICRSWDTPVFGPRKAQATMGDIAACAILGTLTGHDTYADMDAPLIHASHEADDFWLWDRIDHLAFGSGDPKTGRLLGRAEQRCSDLHADEATPSPSG